ncbi:MAG: zinc ribbon domain-containing protein [Dethiobacter sp.]|jgi:putative FmdB family regulatory protein|nr:zinc ribbon domain-containing protein [Dethiobacter sp.]
MPTYEFNCKQCGSKFEALVASQDKGKVRCPVCKSLELKEVYGANILTSRDSSCSSGRSFGFG